MRYDPKEHHRRSIRLHDYNYAQEGAYFVTICTQGHLCLLGHVDDGVMHLSALGEIVLGTWLALPDHYPHVELDAFVVMPNHVHMIVVLVGAGLKPAPNPAEPSQPMERLEPPVRAGLKPAPTTDVHAIPKRHALSEIIRAFKTFTARQINECRGAPGASFWQRNYYEHIIRNGKSLDLIRQYIETNPASWALDDENPDRNSGPGG